MALAFPDPDQFRYQIFVSVFMVAVGTALFTGYCNKSAWCGLGGM